MVIVVFYVQFLYWCGKRKLGYLDTWFQILCSSKYVAIMNKVKCVAFTSIEEIMPIFVFT
jgi:hypothetical protein